LSRHAPRDDHFLGGTRREPAPQDRDAQNYTAER